MWRSAVQVCLGLLSTFTPDHYLGGLAQLARAPALQAGGQRFESVILHTERLAFQKIFDILTQAKTVK